MPTLKSIRKRIVSVKNTQKVTRAMQMIAAARLRKAQATAINARAYAQHARDVALRIAHYAGEDAHPYLVAPESVKNVAFLVLTSDRGLCGGFNENLLRAFLKEWRKCEESGLSPQCTVIGRKGRDALKSRGVIVEHSKVGFYDKVSFSAVQEVVDQLAAQYLAGKIDKVVIFFNRFRSAVAQDIVAETILPMVGSCNTTAPKGVEYLYEPSRAEVVRGLIEHAVATQVYQACLESIAGELAARMAAMDSATKNASEMNMALTMQLNRARQASITKDLLDIVNGAESLKH